MVPTPTENPSRPALLAKEVTKTYGSVRALDGVSLTVPEGRCVALVGESGSGKTTLLRSFNAMVDPDGGRIEVRGKRVDPRSAVALRRSLGYVQQEGGLLPHWTLERNAATVPALEGRPDAVDRGRAALALVGLDPERFGSRWPREVSGGQRQRAALARAIAHRPDILLLDEPFGALDAITRVEVRRVFGELRRSLGLTALLVTHDLREAFELADLLCVMRSGRVEAMAPPRELESAPGSAYVAELMAKAGLS